MLSKRIRSQFEASFTKKALDWLFLDNLALDLGGTYLGKIFSVVSAKATGSDSREPNVSYRKRVRPYEGLLRWLKKVAPCSIFTQGTTLSQGKKIPGVTPGMTQGNCWQILANFLATLAVIIIWYGGLLEKTGHRFSSFVPWLIIFALLVFTKKLLEIRKFHLYYVLFLTIALISGFYSVFFLKTDPKLIILGWLLFAQFGFSLILGALTKLNINKLLVFLSLPLALVGIYQFISNAGTPSTWLAQGENIGTRAFGFFGSPNVFGLVLVFAALLSLGLFLKEKNKLYLVAFVLNSFAIIFTFSRSAWLGLLVGIGFIAYYYKPKIFLFSPIVFFALLSGKVRDRILIIFTPGYLVDSSLDGRIWSFLNGFYLFRKFPLLGTGPGTYGGLLAANYASPIYLLGLQNGYTALYFTDNSWLEILVQTGTLGFIAFTFFAVAIFYGVSSQFKLKKDIMIIVTGAIFLSFLVAGLFENVLEFGAVAIPLGLILGSNLHES